MRLDVVRNDGTTELWMAHFTHIHVKQPIKNKMDRLGDKPLMTESKTICTVHQGRCAAPTRPCGTANSMIGETYLSPKDNYHPTTGRKYAFTHAISALDKDLRERLWEAFFLQLKDAICRQIFNRPYLELTTDGERRHIDLRFHQRLQPPPPKAPKRRAV